jgi:hypothetical protein
LDPARNLYWGAAFGVKAYFKASNDWTLLSASDRPKDTILERCVFKHKRTETYLVADAYQGGAIRDAVTDFLYAAAGVDPQSILVTAGTQKINISIGGGADLVGYVGHDAFMDFQIARIYGQTRNPRRPAIILACASKAYFGPYLKGTGAYPLLWTTRLMAPEAYTLKAALDGWLLGENAVEIRARAAQAYDRYQHCGLRSAERLFATGW